MSFPKGLLLTVLSGANMRDIIILRYGRALTYVFRVHLGCSLPSIWPALRRLWSAAEDSVTADDSEDVAEAESAIVSAGKFTRNLVAGVASNQERAL